MEIYIYIVLAVLLVAILVSFTISKKKKIETNNQVISQVQQKKIVEELIPISIYYGSQQGTAAKFAKQLAEEGRDVGFITSDIDLNEVNFTQEMIEGKVGIFCMATHGEGDPTDNAKKFIEWLSQDQKSLKNFRFAVFGLGNRQYEHYNKIGKLTNKLLESQQGTRCYEYGEGDANSSLEDDFIDWKNNLWTELKVSLKDLIEKEKNKTTQIEQVSTNVDQDESNYIVGQSIKLKLTQDAQIDFSLAQGQYDFQTKQFLKAKDCSILSIEELRQNLNDGSTLKLVINTREQNIDFQTAMNLGVYPENDETQVKEIAEYLKENLQSMYSLEFLQSQKSQKMPFPSPISVETILTHFVDFNGQLMKNTLQKLSKIVEDDQIKNKLLHLTTNEGKQEFDELVNKNLTTIFELLKKFNIQVNLAQFIELCPRISPRLFTIASSSLKNPNQVEIAASILQDNLPNGQVKVGLCSQYFLKLNEKIQQGQSIKARIDFRESSFKIPENPELSIMMIGAGTGVVPFIGFLQDREIFLQNSQQKQNQYILYFGCKHQVGDFIYKNEILEFEKKQIVDKLFLAFSRDQGHKVYVQDLISQNRKAVYQMIQSHQVVIYMCGSTSMGNSVQKLLKEILVSEGQQTEDQAEHFITEMEKQKHLIKELW